MIRESLLLTFIALQLFRSESAAFMGASFKDRNAKEIVNQQSHSQTKTPQMSSSLVQTMDSIDYNSTQNDTQNVPFQGSIKVLQQGIGFFEIVGLLIFIVIAFFVILVICDCISRLHWFSRRTRTAPQDGNTNQHQGSEHVAVATIIVPSVQAIAPQPQSDNPNKQQQSVSSLQNLDLHVSEV